MKNLLFFTLFILLLAPTTLKAADANSLEMTFRGGENPKCNEPPSNEAEVAKIYRETVCNCRIKYAELINSSDLNDMYNGNISYTICLRQQIEKFSIGFFDEKIYKRSKFLDHLDKAYYHFNLIISAIYNDNKNCAKGCGWDTDIFRSAQISLMYEDILGDLISNMVFHKMPIPSTAAPDPPEKKKK
ncbi:MAG: hypothetical protein AB7G80_09255 [Dongiaceae bacterium]